MMNRNFEKSLAFVLVHEGGFVNHPRDPGGATNKGVTLANFRRYVKPKGSISDLKKLTVVQAGAVYRRQYWDRVHGAELPSGVDYAVFDFGVNSGPSRSIKYLQKVVGVAQDGRIGPATLEAVFAMSAESIIDQLCDLRMAFLRRLKIWNTFKKGWSRRVRGVRVEATRMVTKSKPTTVPFKEFIPDKSTHKPTGKQKPVKGIIAVVIAAGGVSVLTWQDKIATWWQGVITGMGF